MNVFFVGEIFMNDTQFSDAAVALSQTFGTPNFVRRDTFVQDNLKGNSFERTLAHDYGHTFGANDNATDGDLMQSPGLGKTIPDQDATRMNNSLASAPP